MGQTLPVVLVVDDEALQRWHAADLLAQAGYHVVEADDAATALRILEDRDDVQILFTDVQMPGAFDGIELARRVRARWPGVLLIVTSGQADFVGADLPDHGCFVAKPYHPGELLGTMSGLIARREA